MAAVLQTREQTGQVRPGARIVLAHRRLDCFEPHISDFRNASKIHSKSVVDAPAIGPARGLLETKIEEDRVCEYREQVGVGEEGTGAEEDRADSVHCQRK